MATHFSRTISILALASTVLAESEYLDADFTETSEFLFHLDSLKDQPAVSDEQFEATSQITSYLIERFNMQPVSSDPTTNSSEHVKVFKSDIDGLGWDFARSQVTANNYGISEEATVQLALTWKAPFYLNIIDRYTLLSANPQFIMELVGSMRFGLHLGWIEFIVDLRGYPFLFTPFNILLRQDMVHTKRRC